VPFGEGLPSFAKSIFSSGNKRRGTAFFSIDLIWICVRQNTNRSKPAVWEKSSTKNFRIKSNEVV
jgi:hypothetical protein